MLNYYNMKKKIFLALMALATSFSLVSCGDDDKDDDPKPKGGGDIENSAFSIKYETGDDSYEFSQFLPTGTNVVWTFFTKMKLGLMKLEQNWTNQDLL